MDGPFRTAEPSNTTQIIFPQELINWLNKAHSGRFVEIQSRWIDANQSRNGFWSYVVTIGIRHGSNTSVSEKCECASLQSALDEVLPAFKKKVL